MSNEIGPVIYTTGKNLYAILNGVNSNSGKVFRTSNNTWEILDSTSRSNYVIDLSEIPLGQSKYYGDLPGSLTLYIGYCVSIYEKLSSTPQTTDIIIANIFVGPVKSNIVALFGEEPTTITGLALEQTCQEVLAKLGNWSETNNNTILGALKAIMRKDVNTPTDIGGTYEPLTDSLEAISETNSGGMGNFLSSGVENTYLTVDSANQYFSNHGNPFAWVNSSNENKLKALLYATKLIDRLKYLGDKLEGQDLEFPRDDQILVPEAIQNACAEIALELLSGETVESQYSLYYNQSEELSNNTNPFYLNNVKAGIPSIVAWDYLKEYLPMKIQFRR